MTLLDGNYTSNQIKNEIAIEVSNMKLAGLREPHLVAILVGNDGASQTYVNAKVKACNEVGIRSTLIQKTEDCTEEELLQLVASISFDSSVDGLLVQLPIPKHIDENKILLAMNPSKDVDGFHPENIGRMTLNLPCFLPATPAGIIQLLSRYQVPTEGKHAVVIGRSHIVGLPMSILLQRNAYPGNCTVTITHSKTKNLKQLCQEADIIIAAIGRPQFVTADMVKEGAVVVDVGITWVQDHTKKSGFRIVGDVKFDEVAPRCAYITPVPGGVGPMTIVSLLTNTLQAAKNRV